MLETAPSLDADRIALTNMFKAIAEYGRKVRLRRQAGTELAESERTLAEKMDCPDLLDASHAIADIVGK